MSAPALPLGRVARRDVRAARTARVAPLASLDSLDRYLCEIAAYPLISRDEEAELARRIRAGDADAVDALVQANLRFVVSIAKQYRHHGVALIDLINDGNLGLLRAATRFDETKGIKFISYAVWWIRQAIQNGLSMQSRTIHVPRKRAGTLSRIGRHARRLEQMLGRDATSAELAEGTPFSEREIAAVLAIGRPCISLDAPRTPDTDAALADRLADETGERPDEALTNAALRQLVQESLDGLREREARILRLYFGFDDDPLTLEQIGLVLGITRERVRQIKERALARLRGSSVGAALATFH